MLMYAAPQLEVKAYSKFNKQEFINKAENFYPFLYQYIKYNQFVKHNYPVVERYTIEGDSFLPQHVSVLKKEFKIKACFLGSSNLPPEILLENPSKNDWWIKKLTSKQLRDLCEWIMEMSNFLKNECKTHKLAYFDLAKNHHKQIETAYRYLLT